MSSKLANWLYFNNAKNVINPKIKVGQISVWRRNKEGDDFAYFIVDAHYNGSYFPWRMVTVKMPKTVTLLKKKLIAKIKEVAVHCWNTEDYRLCQFIPLRKAIEDYISSYNNVAD